MGETFDISFDGLTHEWLISNYNRGFRSLRGALLERTDLRIANEDDEALGTI